MAMSETRAAWTFGSITANSAETLRPMPMEGAADNVQRIATNPQMWWPWFKGLKTIGKFILVSSVLLVVVGVPILIVAVTGGFNAEDSAPVSTLTLRKLTYACADGAQSPSYNMIGASGSTHLWKPAWEGTLYAKDPDGNGATGCVEEYQEYAYWPPVTLNNTILPTLPAGVNATLGTKLDASTGYYHLTIGGCIAYYYSSNTATAWWQSISTVWPAFGAEHGMPVGHLPVCS